MRRVYPLTVILLVIPFMGGCVFPYCAYPTLDYIPSVKLESPSSDVHAIRIDIYKPTADLSVFDGPIYERLSKIEATSTDEIPAQLKPSFSHGLVVIGIAVNFLTHTSHSVAIRLYRPGYEVVEVKTWERVNRVVWKVALDLEAQEKAVDTLLPFGCLELGSKSPAHRDALFFGAAEYERLAANEPLKDHRTRLTKKADHLRKLANAKEAE